MRPVSATCRSSRSRGFTLVELLVVIGIIALLIAILLPSLSRARESATRLQCSSNMRQVMLALRMYMDDNQGYQPMTTFRIWTHTWSNASEYLWFVRIAPYLGINEVNEAGFSPTPNGQFAAYVSTIEAGRRSVLFCPSVTWQPNGTFANAVATWPNGHIPGWHYTSYAPYTLSWTGINAHYPNVFPQIAGTPGGWTSSAPDAIPLNGWRSVLSRQLMRSPPNPSDKPVFAHFAREDIRMTVERAYGGRAPSYQYTNSGGNLVRRISHGNVLPVAYLDGHVQTIPFADYINPDLYGPPSTRPHWYAEWDGD